MERIRLHVSREIVSVQAPNREQQSTRALVALGIEAGRIGIVAVGEDEAELRVRFARPAAAAPARGISGRILAASAGKLPAQAPLRIVRPFDDPYWDRAWQDSYALRSADPVRSREILWVAPLAEASWSPHLIQGLLMYVLWTSSATGERVWPAFRRPKLELVPADDLRGLQYEELVDQLRLVWGPRRVLLPPDRPVSPPPPTTMTRTARALHLGFWIALVMSFVLSGGGTPSLGGVIAAGAAIVLFLARRVALARARAELPRRSGRSDLSRQPDRAKAASCTRTPS